jgi:hypothetical protein
MEKSFDKHTPVHPLPDEILSMKRDETVCQFCGVSYLIHTEIKKLENRIKVNLFYNFNIPMKILILNFVNINNHNFDPFLLKFDQKLSVVNEFFNIY